MTNIQDASRGKRRELKGAVFKLVLAAK